MAKRRYDRPHLIETLNGLTGRDELAVVVIAPGLPKEGQIIHDWMSIVLDTCLQGETPDLGMFPDLPLQPRTPVEDERWKHYQHAHRELEHLGSLGLAVWIEPLGPKLGALQLILDGEAPHVRLNGAIRGIFWAMLEPNWLQVGWALPSDEREKAAHITLLKGTVGVEPACLIDWDVTPALIRSASPEKLLSMQDKSIGVAQARSLWQGMRPNVDPGEIRSHLWEASKAGVHPDEQGTYIAKAIERDHRAGLPSPNADLRVIPESMLRRGQDDAPTLDDLIGPNVEPSPEDELLAAESAAHAEAVLDELYSFASEEERTMLDAFRVAYQQGATGLADAARRSGWKPGDVYAVLKRLRRKANRKL